MKNLPNILTFLRLLLVPLAAWLFWGPGLMGYTLLVVALACFTDWLDGYLARRLNAISNLGKQLDPLADKLLVAVALFMCLSLGCLHWLALTIILTREVAVTVLRSVLAGRGTVMPADFWGKLKTFLQMTGILVVLAMYAVVANGFYSAELGWFNLLMSGFFWLTAGAALLSGINYFLAFARGHRA